MQVEGYRTVKRAPGQSYVKPCHFQPDGERGWGLPQSITTVLLHLETPLVPHPVLCVVPQADGGGSVATSGHQRVPHRRLHVPRGPQ